MNMMAQPEVFCAAAILAQVSARCHLWMRLEGGLSGTARFLLILGLVLQPCRSGEVDTLIVLAPEAAVPVTGAGMACVMIVGLVDLEADAVAGAPSVDMEAKVSGGRRGASVVTRLCPSFWLRS